ncbi:Zn(II)2Cys6 transcription factor [Aspergillus ibericus CBS 121593]|uniref:C2H2 type zinc finger domain protein n=1 Tax=Aspergillus ibericus CBS 121593 TaxID=1448316 RepID=A0A395H4T0_9EURO|nr:hypothetical protein BO80DRAFT_453595 [Aspergillus ibericus CBS 121593]RAL02867.1 hypothetical protein BO80DRAFT_453595 [Aspergillus ibericus CBS 121593]
MHSKPYVCRFPRCTASYQRTEHRRRHEAHHHSQGQSFKCTICGREFGRSDTHRRHMRMTHGVEEPARVKLACTDCRNQKARCQGGPPCRNCLRRGVPCSLAQESGDDGQQNEDDAQQNEDDAQQNDRSTDTLSVDQSQPPVSRSDKERHYIGLYFRQFHPHWRFVHQATFMQSAEAPLLVQSMVVIGLWLSNEDGAQSRAIALHEVLSSAIHQQKEIWDASESDDAGWFCSWPIPTYQAILLHIIFAILCKDRGALGLDLRPCLSPADADLLRRLVVSCKKLGMLYYPNMLARYGQTDPAPYVWVCIEEVKRFNIALYRVCRACGDTDDRDVLATATASNRGLRAQDLRFPLPKSPRLWHAMSKEEWVSAMAEGVPCHDLDDTLEREWISNSAHVLEALDAA